MPRITVDGREIECKDHQMILQACLDAGVELPYYCYHPGLSIVASCRICLVEVEGLPKLVPSCQTPVRDGMVVFSNSTKAVANRKAVMEFLLTSHPLDCPVCDQAGECFLQDYSFNYGRSEARFEEDKERQAKKDIGKHILLYSDRCIYCTRCIRFTREVSGTSELYMKGRAAQQEVDAFPGKPIDNKLSLNVVDLCPVGALLEKEFLFKKRVWLLRSTPSITPADSGGDNTWIDHGQNVVHRIRPRYNAEVNQWWISDDSRHLYQVLYDKNRLFHPMTRQQGAPVQTNWNAALDEAAARLTQLAGENGPGTLYAMLSPMMACEEAWLLARWMRGIDPQAVLMLGPVPRAASDEVFHNYLTKKETFRIPAEKVPNAAGIRRVIKMIGGPSAEYHDLRCARPELDNLKAGWIVGGYLSNWIPADRPPLLQSGFRVVQDLLANALTESADIVLPAAAWAEKEGCWENNKGNIQPFNAAVTPPGGLRREGDTYYRLLARSGLYAAHAIRRDMGGPFASILPPVEKEAKSEEFQEL
jgi:NADH-quinone oxidoreductase subunit G